MPLLHAQTETAVANEALSHLKQPSLIDLGADTSFAARVVKEHFASVRDALLRRYPWNFATERAKLNASATAPLFGYARSFPQPNDCLAVREVDGCRKNDWKVEKRAILTDAPAPLKIVYTRNCTEVARWDALFRASFALLLAVACGPELSAEDSRIENLKSDSREMLDEAYPADGAEGEPDDLPNGAWLDERFR